MWTSHSMCLKSIFSAILGLFLGFWLGSLENVKVCHAGLPVWMGAPS